MPWWHRPAGPLTLAGDAIRLGVLVLAVLAALDGRSTTAAMWALVLLGVTLLRVRDIPAVLDALGCGVLLVAGWAGATEAYTRVPHLDLAVHAAAGAVLTPLVLALARSRPRGPAARVGVATATAALLALVWEVLELIAHVRVDEGIYVAYVDTVTDMVATTLGGMLAGLVATVRRADRPATSSNAASSAAPDRAARR